MPERPHERLQQEIRTVLRLDSHCLKGLEISSTNRAPCPFESPQSSRNGLTDELRQPITELHPSSSVPIRPRGLECVVPRQVEGTRSHRSPASGHDLMRMGKFAGAVLCQGTTS